MKILFFLFLFIFGCQDKHLFDELESKLFELDEVYVLVDKKDLHEKFDINESNYEDVIALKTLIVYEQKEIFLFDQASEALKNKIYSLNHDSNIVLEIDSYFYYGVNDSKIIKIVENTLNKQ